MNQKQLSNYISETFNLSKNESERILKYILDTIAKELTINISTSISASSIQSSIHRNRVYLRGFGSFQRTLHPARKFHNIHPGKLETLPTYSTITFNPSKKLIKKLSIKFSKHTTSKSSKA